MAAPLKFDKAVLPPLDYEFHELEPVLSREIIEVHYKKHHQTYINNYNDSIEKLTKALETGNVKEATQLSSSIKFNGGSHINHSIYWKNLAPVSRGGGKFPSKASPLTKAVEEKFGSYEALVEKFNAKAASIQGSGWSWLGYDTTAKKLVLTDTPNQDPLTSLKPILTIDMWEHAWYLQYKNVKADYLKEIWKVVNWQEAEKRYSEAAPTEKISPQTE